MNYARHLSLAAQTALILLLFPTSRALAAPESKPESNPAFHRRLPRPIHDSDFLENGTPDEAKVHLGKMLFFDKILSGNGNISCATCHHPLAATGDGLSLSAGEGARGLGVTRDVGAGANSIPARVPRNAPPLFNLGARIFDVMFRDGRVAADATQSPGFRTPAGDQLPPGLESALAAQAMFPLTSGTEMAGQAGENEVADAAAAGRLGGPSGVWDLLASRLKAIPEYVELFARAFPDSIHEVADINMVHAANAIAAFEAVAWRADQSPFDQYLRGNREALSLRQYQGMKLFYGKARCYQCHSGKFQTDNEFYAICVPQVGPGKGDGAGGVEDFGREPVTGNPADRYKFRTPSLRNVALTAPYGHDGAIGTLEAMIRHTLNPPRSLQHYDPAQLVLVSRPDLDALDLVVMQDPAIRAAITQANEISPVALSDPEIAELEEFLRALTDPRSIDLRLDVPRRVPSSLTMVE